MHINFIADELFSTIAAKFFVNKENGLGITTEKVNDLFYSETGLVHEIYAIKAGSSALVTKNPELKDNRLIQLIQTDFDIDGIEPNKLRVQNTSLKEKWDKDDISRSWEDLIYHKDANVRKLGKELVEYSFYASGFNKNLFSRSKQTLFLFGATNVSPFKILSTCFKPNLASKSF